MRTSPFFPIPALKFRLRNYLAGRSIAAVILPVVLILAMVSGVAWAAGEQLSRSAVLAGGGKLESGGVVLQAAIGQPIAGIVMQGDTRLCSGILCGESGQLIPKDDFRIFMPVVLK